MLKKKIAVAKSFRLFYFDVLNDVIEHAASSSDDEKEKEKKKKGDEKQFLVQMYGINEKGETCSIIVDDFEPFFYIKVGDNWDLGKMNTMVREIKSAVGEFYKDSITHFEMVDSQKLYGFSAGKKSKFVKLVFKNTVVMNKVKNLWYQQLPDGGRKVRPFTPHTQLYEANLPPLLRFFHLTKIYPNGWVMVSTRAPQTPVKTTTCTYEYVASQTLIKPLPEKETIVPYKIMSFDIEAGSSHGDFPLPKKTYKRLAINMMDNYDKLCTNSPQIFKQMVLAAFGYGAVHGIDLVYPKQGVPKKAYVEALIAEVLQTPFNNLEAKNPDALKVLTVESMFSKLRANANEGVDNDNGAEGSDDEAEEEPGPADSDDDDDDGPVIKTKSGLKAAKNNTIIDIVLNPDYTRDQKVEYIDQVLTEMFPPLEGDPVTMIGSTFLNYGSAEPYLNHCIVLGGCTPVEGATIEAVPIIDGNKLEAEKTVLLKWAELVQQENPDIIIGYNIFGFDYEFLFRRAEETHCVNEFLQLSRRRNEFCGKRDRNDPTNISIENTKIAIASGEYDLRYVVMSGRLQVDMYSYFRRNFNLSSYKLDDVASQNISDDIKKIANVDHPTLGKCTELYTKNLIGLHAGDFIHIEVSSFTSDYYMDGKKFTVLAIEEKDGYKVLLIADHHADIIDKTKKLRWGMAKDDVSPQDIFRMSNGTDAERAVVAKYCIQDCNLVHHLMRKIDVLTEYMEMSNLCSVPINFLVFRGQGIKLTSFVAKKCMEKGYLMPDLEKGKMDGGYEGAIVLPPKTKIYIDEPVACVDYSSLYPSSMISQNYCHSSKVWAKEYDLNGKLVKEEGEKDRAGNYIYYGLSKYEYVEVEFDTFEWRRNPERPAAKAVKTKVGKRVVCWAQLPNNEKSVMPSILMELLKAREDTKKKAKKAADPFMANILDKRQLAYKVTANSLYGQCGARTSTFYEKDVAASTTATGRMSITYARRIIEEIYAERVCQTKNHGLIMTNAEYVYGDTDSVFFIFNLTNKDTGEKIVGKDALEITIELAQEAAHYSSMFLKPPMNLAYEKTLMPFALLSKKRYVGILYEEDPNKGKLKYMGLSLKRRDSCDYLKDTYGQIINIIMSGQSVQSAIQYLDSSLTDLIKGNVPTDKLAITKSLRSYYKNPQQIAHRVLADRIGQRDPGNMPKPGDRIKFLHVVNQNKKALQGEKIETPEFILDNKLKLDFGFYVSNQLMKPLCQFLGLALEDMWKNQNKMSAIKKYKSDIVNLQKEYPDFETFIKKKEKYCTDKVKELLFDKHLMQINNDKNGLRPITSFFGNKR
jgi:DNA polymerase elongation subunit (family B)